jgi:hypothetical protein
MKKMKKIKKIKKKNKHLVTVTRDKDVILVTIIPVVVHHPSLLSTQINVGKQLSERRNNYEDENQQTERREGERGG